jgi:hypothetical protein
MHLRPVPIVHVRIAGAGMVVAKVEVFKSVTIRTVVTDLAYAITAIPYGGAVRGSLGRQVSSP